ncbi:MAG: PAS domain S-box protein [Candidatus Scalindua rubra]|uniref:histidine kinase n=1 Tax=Candidatus Scalindua brodae TaxID=237368 RepID=A0A0B0EL11_9BACT|nr:MAG: two-component sensor kinase [Candidatus Scalindua brodae]MBZ0109383.1 PAS domain S-box protein [Candidatus Scalindua rubra]TWU34829.1 Sporulation kinase A [Candidatus Brocadiaceae bacterium S225]
MKGKTYTDLHKEAELRLNPDTIEMKNLSDEEVRSLAHELQVHRIELEMQNEELHKAQVQVEALLRKYSDLYNFAPVGYFTTNEKGLILETNLRGASMLGIERSLLGKKYLTAVKEDQDTYYLHRRKCLETGNRERCELRIAINGGGQFFALLESIAVQDAGDNISRIRTLVTDITERKLAEDKKEGLARFPEENPNPVMRVFVDGKILYSNMASMVLLAHWGSRTTGKLPNDYIKIVSNVLHSGLNQVVEAECDSCVFALTFAPIKKMDYVNIYGLDITERKQAVKALQQSEMQYRTLVEAIPDIIYKVDENGFFTFLNNSVRTLGYKPEELIGSHFSTIVHPDDVKLFNSFMSVLDHYPSKVTCDNDIFSFYDERKNRGRDTKNQKLRLVPKVSVKSKSNIHEPNESKTIFCEITVTGFYCDKADDKGSRFHGMLGIITDITDKMKMQVEMVRADKLALIGEMAANLSHEINNPINGIMNCAQLIMDESKKNTRLYKFSKIIIAESKRIATLTKSLLNSSRRAVGQKSHLQIYETIYHSLRLMMIQLKKDNIIVKFNISKDTPDIYGSFQELQQVFLNLVQNARYALNEKYPGKDMDKILEVSCNKISISDNQYVRIIFHDHGIGIPDNLLNKTTTPFFTTKPITKGTGLGLSISQRIVYNHDGKMVVESVYGKFTKIIIDLPVKNLKERNSDESKNSDNR